MGRKSQYNYEFKLKAVQMYMHNEGSQRSISKQLGISYHTLQNWINKYKTFGEEGLLQTHINQRIDKIIKLSAIHDYLSGKGSSIEICQKYKISGNSLLLNWIKVYNSGHKELKTTSSGGNRTMTKARKTTFDERIEIVQFCIANDKDYALTMEKFNVSYQQIYLWVRKYETKGVDGLIDRRGKVKPKSDITEVDRLKAEYKLLEAKNKQLEMEVNVLKKLAEVERMRR